MILLTECSTYLRIPKRRVVGGEPCHNLTLINPAVSLMPQSHYFGESGLTSLLQTAKCSGLSIPSNAESGTVQLQILQIMRLLSQRRTLQSKRKIEELTQTPSSQTADHRQRRSPPPASSPSRSARAPTLHRSTPRRPPRPARPTSTSQTAARGPDAH